MLLHLNGAPGAGKSTLARRWADQHPDAVVCDIDVLRTTIDGWQDDFQASSAAARTLALTQVEAHLRAGRSVVLPQLVMRAEQLTRFRVVAARAGARHVHVLLDAPVDVEADRFLSRPATRPGEEQVRRVVEDAGGRAAVAQAWRAVHELAAQDPTTLVVDVRTGDLDGAYDALVAAVGSRLAGPDSP